MSVELEARVRRANLITQDRHLERLYDDDLSRRLLRDVYSMKEGRMTETTDRPEPVDCRGSPKNRQLARRPILPIQPAKADPCLAPAILTAVIAIGAIVALYARDRRRTSPTHPVGDRRPVHGGAERA